MREMPFTSVDWQSVNLVGFDVDGTLYSQRRLRLAMLQEMAGEVLRSRSIRFVQFLKSYRHLRELAGSAFADNFEQGIVARTAAANRCSEERVREVVLEWIHERPLKHLPACRYAGVSALFAGLKASGKSIGIFSDYPAKAKLAALELKADHIVCAGDEGVPRLKPDPGGLKKLITDAGALPTTLFIGDRIERDGEAARAVGVRVLIRSTKMHDGWQTFRAFDDALFLPVLCGAR